LRVLAHLSQDKNLLDAFLNNVDVHAQTSAYLFDVPIDQVTHEQRQLGKRINFSIFYGLTPYGLSKDLHMPLVQAKKYIEKYFSEYPHVRLWMDRVIEETKEHGYVTTLWGRRRYLPGIYEKNKTLYEQACRMAVNTKAQGTAAELMKKGMIDLQNVLLRDYKDAHMLLQIHDELLLTVPLHQVEVVSKVTKDVLEHAVDWTVPLEVTPRSGINWKEVTK
jgi:DNA polymerase I